jgi:hypothetical protein
LESGDDDEVAAARTDVLTRVGLALGVVCALVACGSDAAAPGDDGSADTARIELVITRSDQDGRLAMRGSYDYRRRRGSVTTELEGAADGGSDTPTEVRFIGDRYYSEYQGEGRTYWVVDTEGIGIGYPAEAIVPLPEGDADPKQSLERMFAAGDEVELAQDDVRGAATMHYRVKLEPRRLSQEVGRPLDMEGGAFSVDVWADEAARVRRIRIIEDDIATLTYEFFDFGVDVDVERPPDDQIVTQEEFDRLPGDGVCDPPRMCLEQKEKD